ncbi:iron complex transport system permease protein [Actinokineospora alba]|uniref:Iron complex transport system permease protein n=1 Tax=Actinokineospora alba TaxID=504798 RepID=A0A1H0VCB7_9PSEU|nr:iron ABC transporter permease [Actinokineospora alba]TDP65629.1 iron complex transport system permease protein [Actinokineospora alba]SDH67087.1 iron complex transport system permease protein [Actinokineospora alba]SDP76070.1 iron complex transport system permease protein [Actinokineospora alba]
MPTDHARPVRAAGQPAAGVEPPSPLVRRTNSTRAGVVTVGTLAAIVVLAAVHLTQGTSSVDVFDVLKAVVGQGDPATLAVLEGSRIPRLLTALLVGLALGVAGAGMQSVARNPLASPDTLAVNAGAHLAVVAAAVTGIALPTVPAGAVAFLGGLAAAAAVLGMSGGGTASPRLVLVGSAIALTLHSATILLLLLFEQETTGLFAWGSGSLTVSDLVATQQMTPVVLVALVALIAMGPSLDVLALGDDTATVFGLRVRRTRIGAVLLTVALTAAAVTVAGPVGFVGLCAPVITRLLAPRIGGHRITLPLSGLVGVVLVLGADVALRAAMGSAEALRVPTGVVTTILGAAVLVWLARRGRSSGPAPSAPTGRVAVAGSRRRLIVTGVVLAVLLAVTPLLGLMLGDRLVLLGDLANWLSGRTGPALTFVLDQRLARVAAALTAGAALAIAGCAVQSVSRNPLAEPGLLGITAGAGIGAVTLITAVPMAGAWHIAGAAGLGAAAAFALVYGLAWRSGLDSDRLVIIGIATWSGGMAVITLLLVTSDPWNTAKALTWLSGSTYGRTLEQLIPIAMALAVLTPLLWSRHRELDLHALDDDTPRVLGLRVDRSRLLLLAAAGVLAATAVSAIGVVGFVGLVAPHLARSLVGGRHGRVIPVAAVLGAGLVSVADTLGRTVIAPAQVPAGLVIALIGTPYFVLVLWRTRSRVG